MHKEFKALGISYKNTPLEVREMLSYDEDSTRMFLRRLKEYTDIPEVLVLSTCNRTELYYSSPVDRSEELLKHIALDRGITDTAAINQYFIKYNDPEEATRHLFDVAIGLEAQVVGDLQIINQVKRAYQWSADEDLAGPYLHRLLHTIFFTNKRVVQETPFRDGAASISYATVELIEGLVAKVEEPKILVLGLGEIGEDVCKNLTALTKARVFISNRTGQRASEVAYECNFDIIPFDEVKGQLGTFDVVISSLRTEEPFIGKSELEDVGNHSFRYLFDLSVPRSIAPEVEEIPGVLLYNIDGIQNKTSAALNRRMEAIPKVKEIMAETIDEFATWSQEMEVSPTINKLKNALEQIRREEMARYLKHTSDKEQKMMDKVTKSMIQKIIKLPVLQLKAACKRGEAETLIDVLNDLFELEHQSSDVVK